MNADSSAPPTRWYHRIPGLHSAAAKLSVKSGTVAEAVRGDEESVRKLFRTFLPEDETIVECAYLGVQGLWGFGRHCWGCVTQRRFAKIVIGPLRGVYYEDIFGDRIDRVEFLQPSGWQYFGFIAGVSVSVLGFCLGLAEEMNLFDWRGALLLALPLPFAWYLGLAAGRRLIKRGIICRAHREKVEVYCDPEFVAKGIRLLRGVSELRESRARLVAMR
jgi:hypothetical protein